MIPKIPGFLRPLVKAARFEGKKSWTLAWPEEPIKDDNGELWISICNRYAVKRRTKSDVYAIEVYKVVENDVNGGVIAQNCKGVVTGMFECSKHLAEQIRREQEPKPKPEETQEKPKQIQHHGRHRRSRGGTVASKIADRLRQATRANPVTLEELAQINVNSTGADMAKATRNAIWYLGHMRKGDRGMPLIQWTKRGNKYHVE